MVPINWVVDKQNRVHVQACRHAGNKAVPYKGASARSYAEMLEHLARLDYKDHHYGPCVLTACSVCVPASA